MMFSGSLETQYSGKMAGSISFNSLEGVRIADIITGLHIRVFKTEVSNN